MKLFENSILYGPEQEGTSGGSGNSIIPDQILEGKALQGLIQDSVGVEAEQQETTMVEEIVSPESEAETAVSLDALLGDLVGELQQEVEEANKPPFEIDPETGLSLEGKTVQEIKDRLIQLENRQATDIEEFIHSSRGEEQGQLQSVLEIAQTSQNDTLLQIQKAFNSFKSSYPDSPLKIEEFIARKDTLKNIVDDNERKVKEAEASLAEFEVKTQKLINDAYEAELQATRDRLEALKPEYKKGSPAEKHDKQVLLEQKFTSIDSLKGIGDMREFFEYYGYKAGIIRFEELKQQSDTELYSDSPIIQMYNEAARQQREREENNLNQELRSQESELSTAKKDETYLQAEELERNHTTYQFQLNWIRGALEKIDFDIELTQDGFKLMGETEIQNSIATLDQEIETIQEQNAKLLRDNGYEVKDAVSSKSLESILLQVQSDLEGEKSKWGVDPTKDQEKISRLSALIKTLKVNQEKEAEISTQISEISNKFDLQRSKLSEGDNGIAKIYEQISSYTKDILQNAENKSITGLISTIGTVIQELENYKTPDELIAKREHITELEEAIRKLKQEQEDLRR